MRRKVDLLSTSKVDKAMPGKSNAPVEPGTPVIDRNACHSLGTMLGRQRMGRIAADFIADGERRLALVERADATPAELQEHTHALVSMAGHLGLLRLSDLCRDLQEQARGGRGLEHRPALRSAFAESTAALRDTLADDLFSAAASPSLPPHPVPTATAGARV